MMLHFDQICYTNSPDLKNIKEIHVQLAHKEAESIIHHISVLSLIDFSLPFNNPELHGRLYAPWYAYKEDKTEHEELDYAELVITRTGCRIDAFDRTGAGYIQTEEISGATLEILLGN